jgi:SAM-dependent methyltransferase
VNIIRHLYRHWVVPACDPVKAFAAIRDYRFYVRDWVRYSKLSGAEPLRLRDSYPCLFDATGHTPFDPHYFYQAHWATDRIVRSHAQRHFDIGSDIGFIGMLTIHLPITFLDIRPLKAKVAALTCVAGSILALPFENNSVESLSCLHVAEHVGLGRYGDGLNPSGTKNACAELQRVLAPKGNLFFSVPVGRPRVCFNAHRIHSPSQILEYFRGLMLVEFSAVDDGGNYLVNVNIDQLEKSTYGCGLFWFRNE